MLALVQCASQSLHTQLQLRQVAMQHALQCARLAARVPSRKLLDAAARCAWNAAWHLVSVAAARGIFVEQLKELCSIFTATGMTDGALQADLNALLCMCLLSSGQGDHALQLTTSATRACPPDGQERLWAWHIQAACASSGGNSVPEAAMSRIGSQPSAFQAAAWLAVAQGCTAPDAQHASLQRCLHAAAAQPALAAQYHMHWAEWLLRTDARMARRDAARDALVYAFKLLTTLDTAGSSDAARHTRPLQQADVGASLAPAVQEPPRQALAVPELFLMVRILLLRALAASDSSEELDWLRVSQHYATRILRGHLRATCKRDPENDDGGRKAALQLPQRSHEWLAFAPPECVVGSTHEVGEPLAISARSVPHVEEVQKLLSALADRLQSAGCTLDVLPLHWLQCCLSHQLQGSEASSACLLEIAVAVKEYGADGTAQKCIDAAGAPTSIASIMHNCSNSFVDRVVVE